MIKNALVLMFDSLQRTYLGCYGNKWIKTPNFDRFAREGVIFDNCYIEGVPTIPCRRAMHTGRYTLPFAGWVALSMEDTTIADLCWGRPIDTAFIFDSPPHRLQKFGYTRGFDKVWFMHGHELDHYYFENDALLHLDPRDYFEDTAMTNLPVAAVENNLHELSCYLRETQYWKGEEDQRVVKVLRKAAEYLRQVDRNKQFYLWIDSFDPHEPWDSPSVYDKSMDCPYNKGYKGKDQFLPNMGDVGNAYTEEQLHHIRMLYAEKVTLCDTYLGEFMDVYRELGFEENTLFLLVSDHGEPMGNGEHGHGIMRKCRPWPYEELVHAPMWLKCPGVKAGQRIEAYVQSCDVAPTVCDWLGIGVHPDMQGKSLLPLVRGEVDKVRDFAIAGYNKFSASITKDGWSYIHWTAKEPESSDASMFAIYAEGILEAQVDDDKMNSERLLVDPNDPNLKLARTATLDGEDQWTCTPGSIAQVPDEDQLFYLPDDPGQLNNLSKEHPEKSRELLQMLKGFMSELKAS